MTDRKPYATGEKLLKFLQDNPGEWLFIEDVAPKFGLSERTAENLLRAMEQAGKIQRRKVVLPGPKA